MRYHLPVRYYGLQYFLLNLLYPSHYRADSGLSPIRDMGCRTRIKSGAAAHYCRNSPENRIINNIIRKNYYSRSAFSYSAYPDPLKYDTRFTEAESELSYAFFKVDSVCHDAFTHYRSICPFGTGVLTALVIL